jgi:hypothetical protein
VAVVDQHDRGGAQLGRDEATLGRYAAELADAVERALPTWVERSVERRFPGAVPDDVRQRARDAGRAAAAEVGTEVRDLLALDIDVQWTNPLALLRSAVRFPAAVLSGAGVPPPHRDVEAERLHPGDVYDLTPAAFADIAPELHEPGLVWGAAKAHVHLARRRAEGKR